MNAQPLVPDGEQQILIGLGCVRRPRHVDISDFKALYDISHTADVVGMRVGGDYKIELLDPLPPQIIHQADGGLLLTGVDQDAQPFRCLDQDGIGLSNVNEVHPKIRSQRKRSYAQYSHGPDDSHPSLVCKHTKQPPCLMRPILHAPALCLPTSALLVKKISLCDRSKLHKRKILFCAYSYEVSIYFVPARDIVCSVGIGFDQPAQLLRMTPALSNGRCRKEIGTGDEKTDLQDAVVHRTHAHRSQYGDTRGFLCDRL